MGSSAEERGVHSGRQDPGFQTMSQPWENYSALLNSVCCFPLQTRIENKIPQWKLGLAGRVGVIKLSSRCTGATGKQGPRGEMERYFWWHCVSCFPHSQNGAITHTAGAVCKGASIGTGMRTILHKWQDCSFQNIFPLCPQYQWRDRGTLTWWLNGTEEASTNNLFMHSEDVRVQPIHESSSQAAKQNTFCKSKPQSKPFQAAA